jgi:hypothetical protein
MNGKQLIEYIQKNNLEEAVVSVTATIYRQGDHDCRTTTNVSIMEDSVYDDEQRKYVPAIDFYVDDELY